MPSTRDEDFAPIMQDAIAVGRATGAASPGQLSSALRERGWPDAQARRVSAQAISHLRRERHEREEMGGSDV